jgi:hypothetical protein
VEELETLRCRPRGCPAQFARCDLAISDLGENLRTIVAKKFL